LSQQDGGGSPGSNPSPVPYLGIGFDLVVPLLVGVFGGRWLDRRVGTTPWLVLVGAVLGAAAGMLSVYRRVVPPGGPAGGRR